MIVFDIDSSVIPDDTRFAVKVPLAVFPDFAEDFLLNFHFVSEMEVL